MKKILQLLTLTALLPVVSQAQITIESSQIKLVGNFAIQSRDTTPDAGILPGGSGSQTWDFSTLKDQSRDSLEFYQVGDTPFASLFPNANVAATLDSIAYIYFEKTDDYLSTHGSYGTLNYGPFTITSTYKYSPPQTIIKFPMQLNDQFAEVTRATIQIPGSIVGLPFDSIRLVTKKERNVTVDAFGQLTTPIGVYETLRSTEVEVSIDSIYTYSSGIWFPSQGTAPKTITFFNWWTNENGLGSPVVQLEQDANGNIEASWLFELISSTKATANLLRVDVSPNPTSQQLRVTLPEGFTGSLEVYNLNGRLQHSQSATSTSETIDVQSFVDGNFVLVLKDKSGKLVGFERFAVLK